MKTYTFIIIGILYLAGCGRGRPAAKSSPEFKTDNLKLHSYQIVKKEAANEKRVFHIITVDRNAQADYFIHRIAFLPERVESTLKVKCLSQALCELFVQAKENWVRPSSSRITWSEDSQTNKKTIEIMDPHFLSTSAPDSYQVTAKDAAGKSSAPLAGELK